MDEEWSDHGRRPAADSTDELTNADLEQAAGGLLGNLLTTVSGARTETVDNNETITIHGIRKE